MADEWVPSYEHCELCPRRCGVDRTAGQRGFCGMPAGAAAARAGVHYWEEPVLSGSGGSGAIFFSGCVLKCRYCQNYAISAEKRGTALSAEDLRLTVGGLLEQGVQNINLVTPTHFVPDILTLLAEKPPVPVVYNCGGYERVETLRALEGKIDIYLPDFKYSDSALAEKLSAAKDYPEVCETALREMVRQVGKPVIENGELIRGVLIRHLVLPGQVDNSLGVIERIAALFPDGEVLVSLMSQYTPMGELASVPPYDRKVTQEEYAAVLSWAELCGIRSGFVQDSSSAMKEYIPEFDGSGLIFAEK